MEFPSDTLTGELQWQDYIPNLESGFREILEKATKIDIPSRYGNAEEMYQDVLTVMGEVSPLSMAMASPIIAPTQLSSPSDTLLKTQVITPRVEDDNLSDSSSSNFLMVVMFSMVVFLALMGGFFSCPT